MKAVMQTLLILGLACLGLTGCGQKGDLFLPETKAPVSTPAEAETEAKQPELPQPEQQPAAETTASPDQTQQAQPSTSNTKR
jgi:predicted small lipoprotein YifL